MEIKENKSLWKQTIKTKKILVDYGICLQIYGSNLYSNFSPYTLFFPVWKNLLLWTRKKCDFQQVTGWQDRVGYGSVHQINVSAAHPATFSKTLNSFIKK